jgi:hypothetical protein
MLSDMGKTRIITMTLLAISSIAISSASAQLIINGGFETPDVLTYLTVSAGQTTIAPWVVGLASVDVVDVDNGFNIGDAFEGRQYLDLDGAGAGQLTQSFRTRPGVRYMITFAYANNYINQSSASATVRLYDPLGDILTRTISHSTSVPGDLHWTLFKGQFTARQSTTSFELTSLSPVDSYGGILVDAVSVGQRR